DDLADPTCLTIVVADRGSDADPRILGGRCRHDAVAVVACGHDERQPGHLATRIVERANIRTDLEPDLDLVVPGSGHRADTLRPTARGNIVGFAEPLERTITEHTTRGDRS